ncbi:ABC transporter permease subunit [Sphingobacterium sp.]|uniref:ABC transporter permease subunit n=1 Tax=Sphingobacterium sp. TaxID=341027 RepID=UPI00289CBE54|nr:ABC transporter permease subunit [Sphingobacterium sp.]
MNKIIRYVFVDLLRNKTILCYTILLFVLSMTVYTMEDNYEKGLLSLLNIVLFVVPLMSIVFSGIYIYQSSEFINCLVSQPLQRKSIWGSLYVGLAGALSLAFFIGVGIPTFIYAFSYSGVTLVGCGLVLSLIFVSIAMWTSVLIRDKSKGIGLSILLWLYFTLLFDALVLFILFQFADYPIEHGMVALSMLNPIDISRILILLQVDLSAMMGYTGAIFRDFFGNSIGITVTLLVMLLWCIIPLWLSIRYFKKKDL